MQKFGGFIHLSASDLVGQVSGPGGPDCHLLHGYIEPRRRPARHGISLQCQSPECRDVTREMRLHTGGIPGTVRSRMPDAASDAIGERFLPVSGDGVAVMTTQDECASPAYASSGDRLRWKLDGLAEPS